MSITKDQTLELISLAINTIAQLKKKDIESLLNNEAVFTVKSIKVRQKKIKSLDNKNIESIEKAIENIDNFTTREEASGYIYSMNLTKAGLTSLSKKLDVHINKSDKKENIINRIVESVIGSKLRVQAIKNTSL